MKKSYNSPKVVITAFSAADNTNLTYISAIQPPVSKVTNFSNGLKINS